MDYKVMMERLQAIMELCQDGIKDLSSMGEEAPKKEEKTTKKTEKPAKETKKSGPSVEDTIKEYGLDEMDLEEIKGYLDSGEVSYKKRTRSKDELLPILAQAIIDGKIPMDDVEEDAADEEVEEESDEIDLDSMSLKELLELAEENEIEIDLSAKDKKNADKVREFLRQFVEGDDSEEETETEDEDGEEDADEEAEEDDVDLEAMSLKELLEFAKENELEIPKKIAKDKAAVIEFITEQLGEEEETEEEEEEEEDEKPEPSPKRKKAEEKIEAELQAQIDAKKLTVKAMKKELAEAFSDDPDCAGCEKCDNSDVTKCYLRWKKAFVDDEGKVQKAEDAYERDGELYCCGRACEELDDMMICPACGNEYILEE